MAGRDLPGGRDRHRIRRRGTRRRARPPRPRPGSDRSAASPRRCPRPRVNRVSSIPDSAASHWTVPGPVGVQVPHVLGGRRRRRQREVEAAADLDVVGVDRGRVVAVVGHRAAAHLQVGGRGPGGTRRTRPTPRPARSPGSRSGRAGRRRTGECRGTARRASRSGGCCPAVPDTSVATTITSVATPASSHDFAVSIAAFPDAHIAETDMAGPWKSWRCICIDSIVDGINCRYSELGDVLGRARRRTRASRSTSPSTIGVDQPDDRAGLPAPLVRVLERLVDRRLHRPREAAAPVLVLDVGDVPRCRQRRGRGSRPSRSRRRPPTRRSRGRPRDACGPTRSR